MKRHRSLQPLSREHHQALVHAKRLREFAGDERAARETAERFLAAWERDIAPHFREEEEILLPVLAQHVPPDTPEILAIGLQHVQLRTRVMALGQTLAQGRTPEREMLVALGVELASHARYEEEFLFPLVERSVPEEDLEYLALLLAGAETA